MKFLREPLVVGAAAGPIKARDMRRSDVTIIVAQPRHGWFQKPKKPPESLGCHM